MSLLHTHEIPVTRIQLQFKVTQTIGLPEYAGSMLRGAFGGALRQTACMTKQKTCTDCPLIQTCPYTQIFEKPAPQQHSLQKFSHIPNGYIIEPPPWGERVYTRGDILTFQMVLVGRIRSQIALIIYAWQRAFERGIGYGTAELDRVIDLHNQTDLYQATNKTIQPIHQNNIRIPSLQQAETDCVLHFYSPLRLQNNGRIRTQSQLDAATLLKAVARRAHLIFEFHTDQTLIEEFSHIQTEIEKVTAAEKNDDIQLKWRDWTRYSSRQKTTMQLGGLVGSWMLHNVSPEIYELLQMGTYLHVGKETTFGLGGYQIVTPSPHTSNTYETKSPH